MRGCHSPGTGRITAPGSSWRQSTRIVQRKRRPTTNVDWMMVLRARRGADRFEIRHFAGRAIPFPLVRSTVSKGLLSYVGPNGSPTSVLPDEKRQVAEKTMKVLLTGGSGDLGQTLVPRLLDRGDAPVILDVSEPRALKQGAVFIQGSILDRLQLPEIFRGCDCIVHIAAWHGIHEDRGERNAYDFFDLNVRGTFEVFEAAASLGIDKIVFISTTSVYRPDSRYGSSKILAEAIAEDYRKHRDMNVITLRPRGFIPYWNREVYASYSDWARWFWKGAVHIDDVAAAVILSLALISRQQAGQQLVLTLDSAYEYTDADLDHWDAEGHGSTFRKYYPEYHDLALSYGLDPALKPTRLDISETVRWLGYKPAYSLANLLSELAAFGDRGPPHITGN